MLRGDMVRPIKLQFIFRGGMARPINFTWPEQYFQKNLACTIRGKKHTERYNFIYWLHCIAAIQTNFFC
jgi:hypothetical protein